MTGATIAIDDASAADSILSVKQRVFTANRRLPMHRQRLMYRPGPHGLEPLADSETLGGAGVAQDGSAELDVLIEPLTERELAVIGHKVCVRVSHWAMWQNMFESDAFKHAFTSSIHLLRLFLDL